MTRSELAKLHRLPRKQKIKLVQTLWDEIVQEQEKLDVPEEHIKRLEERIRRIEKGDATFRPWEDVRKKYRKVEV